MRDGSATGNGSGRWAICSGRCVGWDVCASGVRPLSWRNSERDHTSNGLPVLGGPAAHLWAGAADVCRMRQALWRWYGGVGLTAVAAYAVLPAGIGQDVAYAGVGMSSVAAIVMGVRVHHPVRRAPWYLMGFGQSLWVVGDAVDSWFQDVDHASPFPSAADGFLLGRVPDPGAGVASVDPRASIIVDREEDDLVGVDRSL